MALRVVGSLLIVASFICCSQSSPAGPVSVDNKDSFADADLDAKGPAIVNNEYFLADALDKKLGVVDDVPAKGKNLLKKGQQADLSKLLTIEQMFARIWQKYSPGSGFINLQQLNRLVADTDHDKGETSWLNHLVDETWWKQICKEKGADPSKGLSKYDLLEQYFEVRGNSIKQDFLRIFVEEAPPAKDLHNALQQKTPKEMEEREMFDEIWAKYSQDQFMHLQQLNTLLHDTDQERGEQVIDEKMWQSLCKQKGVDPPKGLTKYKLLGLYFDDEGSSIKRDYIRIFVEGAPPSRVMTQGPKAEDTLTV